METMFGGDLFILLSSLLSGIPSVLFGIATYVLSALAIYTISRRRGLRKPWLAWIPVLNVWLLGSLSDQYQYVVNRATKSKRKWLLALSILMSVLAVALIVLVVAVLGSVIVGGGYYNRHAMMTDVLGQLLAILGILVPLGAAAIAYCIIRYMALYDVFKSLDPNNCVLFLVLSILFSPTEPFFLFFNRNKDNGMPPRRQEPVYTQQSAQEPWEQEKKDYL